MTQIDQAVDIREGEELDIAAVDRFMKQAIPDLEGAPAIKQYPGGASNLTYQVDYGDRSYVLRRPPFGHIAKSAHDMLREAKVMRALKPEFPYVPNIVAICDDHDILGCDFYIMERLKGIILRQDFPKDFELSEADTRKLCLNVIDKLVDLHNVDAKATGLDKLGKGAGYVQRQIGGWSDRFRKAKTDDVGDFEAVMGWLNDKMPDDVAQVVIHNDYRFDNVVLNQDNPFEVIGVLDWEMATIGDPLLDLAWILMTWPDPEEDRSAGYVDFTGMPSRAQLLERYALRSGLPVDAMDYYIVLARFKMACVLEAGYARYVSGGADNPKMAMFGDVVLDMAAKARDLAQRSKLPATV